VHIRKNLYQIVRTATPPAARLVPIHALSVHNNDRAIVVDYTYYDHASILPIRTEVAMSKVLVLYYSSYGHVETMAHAIAEGARSTGATVDVRRVPETAPLEVAKAAHFKLNQAAPVATVDELANYDAIIIGTPTRFGRVSSQMASFLDQAGGLWMRGVLNGKVGGAFTSTATQHGGQEATLFSIIANLLHFGMTVVGLPYSHQGQMTLDEIVGGSPYGATTIAGSQGQRQPSAIELEGARFQGKLIAETANKLFSRPAVQ
jgi:NAD(P)H dehydrogenase (quinone)